MMDVTKESYLHPTLFKQSYEISHRIATECADLLPAAYRGKPMNILLAVDYGQKCFGWTWLQSIQNIAIINGRPCVWGDALVALVQSSPHYEWIKETEIYDKNGEFIGCSCTLKRKNHEAYTSTFTIQDAKTAGLWNGKDPWKKYPKRMLQIRARAFAFRNLFADALNGMSVAEEVMDYDISLSGSLPPNKRNSSTNNLIEKLQQKTSSKLSYTKDQPYNIKQIDWPHTNEKDPILIEGLSPMTKKTTTLHPPTTDEIKKFLDEYDSAENIGERISDSDEKELSELIRTNNKESVVLEKLSKRGLQTLSQLSAKDAKTWIKALRAKNTSVEGTVL